MVDGVNGLGDGKEWKKNWWYDQKQGLSEYAW